MVCLGKYTIWRTDTKSIQRKKTSLRLTVIAYHANADAPSIAASASGKYEVNNATLFL